MSIKDKLIYRTIVYSVSFLWFYFGAPLLWNHGSSLAMEFLFFISLSFIIAIFYFESIIKNDNS